MKNIATKIKDQMDGFNHTLNTDEERILCATIKAEKIS
jgi:hypothetical protein